MGVNMTSLTALPANPAVEPTRPDARPFRHGAAEREVDEERYRNRANLAAAIAAVLLIVAGWWIVNSLAETQRAQSCYASGTQYCSLI